MALKVEAKGGKVGIQWDDGSDYHDVTKIYVRGGLEGIQFIKFEYVKAGKKVIGPIHGASGRGFTETVRIVFGKYTKFIFFYSIFLGL